MLFDIARHEPLQIIAWDENVAMRVIQNIAEDTIGAFEANTFWPVHPIEDGTDFIKPHILKGLYFGAS